MGPGLLAPDIYTRSRTATGKSVPKCPVTQDDLFKFTMNTYVTQLNGAWTPSPQQGVLGMVLKKKSQDLLD